jgi:hypothetical protein
MGAIDRQPAWLTVFLDFPAGEFDAGTRFWAGATGYPLSSFRGAHDEFATLVPPAGEAYLKLQRLGEGPTRLHLDLHVKDPFADAEAAEAGGAELLEESPHGYFVMRSPAGFTFCLVKLCGTSVPGPVLWPDGHRSRVSRFCLDVPRTQYAAEVRFFQTLLGGRWREVAEPETALRPASDWALDVRLQPAEIVSEVTSHLHVLTDDLAAEVERLEDLGARRRALRTGKAILEVPGGTALCVVAREAAELA